MCTGVAGCFYEHTRSTLAAITAGPFRRLAAGSAMSRISPAQLRRNATHRQSHA